MNYLLSRDNRPIWSHVKRLPQTSPATHRCGTIEHMARAGDELVNPITCERIVFRKTAAETGGALLEMDDFWMRPGHRAPAHAHPGMRERWEVIAGMASFAIGGVEQRAGPGHVVVADA